MLSGMKFSITGTHISHVFDTSYIQERRVRRGKRKGGEGRRSLTCWYIQSLGEDRGIEWDEGWEMREEGRGKGNGVPDCTSYILGNKIPH